MALTSQQMPAMQGGGTRWYSDLTKGWYTSLADAQAAEQKERTDSVAQTQQTFNRGQTQDAAQLARDRFGLDTTHTTAIDQLARDKFAADQQQQSADTAFAQQKLAQSDPSTLARIQSESEARRLAQLPQYMASMGLSTGAGGSAAPVQYGGVDADAARAAVYARAKDQIANQQRASLTALQSVAAQRGLNVAGGTNPALQAQEGALIGQGQGQLGEVTREQAVQDLKAQQNANDKVYSGNIQQRGQNLSVVPSLMGLVTARSLY